jgi:cyclopropane-fatty-acyl-phospholipid synthase
MQKQMMNSFFQSIKKHSFEVRYWDGEIRKYGSNDSDVRVIFKQPLPADFDLSDPMLSIGDAYAEDLLDFEGDFDEVLKIALENETAMNGPVKVLKKISSGIVSKKSTTKKQKENISHHYDVGNDFFALWLDESMSYSCAYFKHPDDTLFQAQMNKIDLILKKLRLEKGDTLLDIGSGWGWLIIRAAQIYGVKATGITISEEQYRKTVERIAELGLSDRVEVRLLDYMDLNPSDSMYDKVVSVGMFEHVGKTNLAKYMEKINEVLAPGGLSMLHSIMGTREGDVNSWIAANIFPGGYIPSLRETVNLFPDYNFQLLHAENLKYHYARTLDKWLENFMSHWNEIEGKYGRCFTRMWELYLKSSASSFRVSDLNIYQILFSKGITPKTDFTLEDIYR